MSNAAFLVETQADTPLASRAQAPLDPGHDRLVLVEHRPEIGELWNVAPFLVFFEPAIGSRSRALRSIGNGQQQVDFEATEIRIVSVGS